MVFVIAAVLLGANPSAGAVLSRIETYVPPALSTRFPPGDGVDRRDVYEIRLSHTPPTPVPPTKVDTLICDVSVNLADEPPPPSAWTEEGVARVIALYTEQDYGTGTSFGYRLWAHWNFLRSLSSDERKTLAAEIVAYAKANGVRNGEDPEPATPKLLGAWEDDDNDNAKLVALSGDGKRAIASYDSGGWSYEWETASGKRLASWWLGEPINALALSRDGALAAVGDVDQTISVRDTKTGDEVTSWTGRECEAGALAFSADASKLFIACDDGGVLVGDLAKRRRLPASTELDVILDATLTELRRQGDSSGFVTAFSPDRTRVAIADFDEKSLTLWNIAARKEVTAWDLDDDDGKIESFVFSPDGKRLLVGSEKGTLGLWDLATGESEDRTNAEEGSGDESAVSAVAFSPNGSMFLTGAENGMVRLFGIEGAQKLAWRAHTARINSLAFSPDGKRVLSAGYGETEEGEKDSKVRYWDIAPWVGR